MVRTAMDKVKRVKTATIIVFPNQLWDIGTMKPLFDAAKGHGHTVTKIVLWEDPGFFGIRTGGQFGPSRLRLNRLTLAYRRLTCIEAVKRLRASAPFGIVVEHAQVDDLVTLTPSAYYTFDPCDLLVVKTFKKRLAKAASLVILDSPQFLLPAEVAIAWGNDKDGRPKKRLQHRPFFEMVKERIGILQGVPSQDANNRSPPPKEGLHPPSPFPEKVTAARQASWLNALAWVNKHPTFKRNPGPSEDHEKQMFGLAATPKEAMAWFMRFVDQRFGSFGKYEDAIVKGEPWLYHSGISIYLNNGLLVPMDVVRILKARYDGVPHQLANYEGFLRQVMGWREFSRMYYLTTPPAIARANSLGYDRVPLKYNGPWYTGKLGIPIVDDAIKDAWNMGYLHHIRRLMVMSNAMTLWRVHPDEVYRWMHEFALDAYEWVMVFNVYAMGTYGDGGRATRKPYVSSTAYLKRMSRETGGEWEGTWNERFKALH